MLFRRRSTLAPPAREALARILTRPTFELVPLKNALDQAAALPAGATVSVTASPAKGLEATVARGGRNAAWSSAFFSGTSSNVGFARTRASASRAGGPSV